MRFAFIKGLRIGAIRTDGVCTMHPPLGDVIAAALEASNWIRLFCSGIDVALGATGLVARYALDDGQLALVAMDLRRDAEPMRWADLGCR